MAVSNLIAPVTLSARRLVVGLSGGVDSSVAALLLKQQGHDVRGIFMKNWEGDDEDGYCSAREDFLDAVAVAERLSIDIEAVNFSALYRERVFTYFLEEYRSARTPNPDVLCNTEIKFKAFLDHAIESGADLVATGHYARVASLDGEFVLSKAQDLGKDQSYFLHGLNQAQLSRACFPLGELTKAEVRRLARQAQLITHDKKDSTGVCFIGERPFREFLSRFLPVSVGDICTLDDRSIGQHQGVNFYTLGQREGLRIGGVKGAREAPWYVVAKDPSRNVLYVDQDRSHPRLLSRELIATQCSWVSGYAPGDVYGCHAKTRYRQTDQACTLVTEKTDRSHCRVQFAVDQWAVTPGQSVVFYEGDRCLGGGIIAQAFTQEE